MQDCYGHPHQSNEYKQRVHVLQVCSVCSNETISLIISNPLSTKSANPTRITASFLRGNGQNGLNPPSKIARTGLLHRAEYHTYTYHCYLLFLQLLYHDLQRCHWHIIHFNYQAQHTSSHGMVVKALVFQARDPEIDSRRWHKIYHRGWMTRLTQPLQKNIKQ